MAARSWFYPDGFHPRKATVPPKWNANASPYPSLVQHKGRVYYRTQRWQGGNGAPDVEVDAQGFRTWTLYGSAQLKHRWARSAVALHQVFIKPVAPPLNDTEADQPAYAGQGGSSVRYFAQQTGDHFAIIEDVQAVASPSGIYSQLQDDWLTYRNATFKSNDAFTYIAPAFISDSPRWTQYHNQDDTEILQTYTLDDGLGGTYQVQVNPVPGWNVETDPNTGAESLVAAPNSEAEMLVNGFGSYVLGSIGTRPRPAIPIPDLQVTFTKRILVASRHFVGRSFTGYVEAVRQSYQWIADATLPQGQVPDDVQGHLDYYPPIITGFDNGRAIPQTEIPFTFSQYPVTYTVQDEDWIYSPEFRPIDPAQDEVTINIPRAIDEGVFIGQSIILQSVSPGASV